METQTPKATRPAGAGAVLIPSLLVVAISLVVVLLRDELSTIPWLQAGLLVVGGLLLVAAGVAIARHMK